MASPDRPAQSKRAIETVSGNAKVTGGEQQSVGSWAAPITDSGLGQLAQGLSQFGQGANQLSAAFQARRREQEDYNARMAALAVVTAAENRTTEMAEEFKQTLTDPEEYSKKTYTEMEKETLSAVRFGREQLQKQGASERALRTYDALATGNTVNILQRKQAESLQHEQALWNQRVAQTDTTVQQNLMTLSATGDTAAVMLGLGAYMQSQQTMPGLDRLTPAQQTQRAEAVTSFAGQTLATVVRVAMQQLPPDATVEQMEEAGQRQKDMLKQAAGAFTNSPQTYASLVAGVDEVIASAKRARQAQQEKDAAVVIDNAITAMVAGDAPDKNLTAYINFASPTERNKIAVLQAMQPQIKAFRQIVETGTTEELETAEIQLRQYAETAPAEVRAAADSAISEVIGYAKSFRTENYRARAIASGANDPTLAAYTSARTEGKFMPDAVRAALPAEVVRDFNDGLVLAEQSPEPYRNLAQSIGGMTAALSPIAKAQGVPAATLLKLVVDKSSVKPGTQRMLTILPLIAGRENTTSGQYALAAAFRGGDFGGLPADKITAIKAAVAASTALETATLRYSARNPNVITTLEDQDTLQKTVMGMAARSVAAGMSEKEAVNTAVKQLFSTMDVSSAGEPLVTTRFAITEDSVFGKFELRDAKIRPEGRFTDKEWGGIWRNEKLFNNITERAINRADLSSVTTKKLRPMATADGSGVFFQRVDVDTGLPVPVLDTKGLPIKYTWQQLKQFVPAEKPKAVASPKPPVAPTKRTTSPVNAKTSPFLTGAANDKQAVDEYFRSLRRQ